MPKVLQKIGNKWKLTNCEEEQSELDLVSEVYNTPFDEGYAVGSNQGSVDKNPYTTDIPAYTRWLSGFYAGFEE